MRSGEAAFADRARRWRRRRRWQVLAVLCVLGAVVLGLWAVAFSSLFAVRHVEVEGVSGPLQAVVRASLAEPIGQPLLRVDVQGLTAPVAALPQVRSVHASRSWPHRLIVQVQPRRAAAALVDGSSAWLVDAEGVAFEQVTAVPEGLIRLVGIRRDSAALRAALRVSADLPAALSNQVDAISASSADGVLLRLAGSRTVLWGDDSEGHAKGQVALALLGAGDKAVDVSAPDAPAVR